MRFLGGLLVGGAVTLLLATAVDLPTNRLTDRVAGWWNELLLVTGEPLFITPQAISRELPVIRPVAVVKSSAQLETPAAAPVDLPIPVDAVIPADGDTPVDAPASVDPSSTQAVWVPFRSRLSADGFARRLSMELDHPFSVNRQGPGRYQVVFGYVDDLERQDVLERVRAVTELDL